MIKTIATLLTTAILHGAALANPSDTTINGIPVSFTLTASTFPPEWQAAPIHATASLINTAEIPRCKQVMVKALNKYPAALLQTNLKDVYFFKGILFYNVGYGGTNSTDMVYLTNNGTSLGYTDTYLEQTFHHEFSSILFRNFPALLDTMAWKKANITGFDYNDPEAGVGAIRNNESSQTLDTALSKKGFLTQYALSGMENDINTLAQNLFKPEPGFWEIVDKFPRIKQKTTLLISFYSKLSAVFTEKFFRQFAR